MPPPIRPVVDASLVARARSGEEDAWRALFDAYYPRLYRYFASSVPAPAEVEDLASEVLLQAYRSIDRFERRDDGAFGAWLFGIARHVRGSFYRSRRDTGSVDESVVASSQVRDEFLQVEVLDILRRLPRDYRAALELRYVIGLSGAEAAAVMDRSHVAFRALLHRAVRAYRRADHGAPPTTGNGNSGSAQRRLPVVGPTGRLQGRSRA